MPDFDYDGYVNVDVDDFLRACDRTDIEDLIDTLVEDGYLNDSDRVIDERSRMSAPEQLFEDQLQKLHGKWNQLSKTEEEILLAIAKRF